MCEKAYDDEKKKLITTSKSHKDCCMMKRPRAKYCHKKMGAIRKGLEVARQETTRKNSAIIIHKMIIWKQEFILIGKTRMYANSTDVQAWCN